MSKLFEKATRDSFRARLEAAHDWVREWIGEVDGLVLALLVCAFAGIWLAYAI